MPRTPYRRALSVACLALVVAGAVGCAPSEERSGGPPLKMCGVTFWSGAEAIGTIRPGAVTRGMPAAPATSRLPATTTRQHGGPAPRVVSVSSDCSHGRTVVVSPLSSVRVRTVAKDRAGRLVALSLVSARLGSPVRVHVYVYDGTRPTGQVVTTVF